MQKPLAHLPPCFVVCGQQPSPSILIVSFLLQSECIKRFHATFVLFPRFPACRGEKGKYLKACREGEGNTCSGLVQRSMCIAALAGSYHVRNVWMPSIVLGLLGANLETRYVSANCITLSRRDDSDKERIFLPRRNMHRSGFDLSTLKSAETHYRNVSVCRRSK